MKLPLNSAAHQEAKRHPGGWVYEIDGNYGPNEPIPPEAIVGAWKVDLEGIITEEFVPNPNYRRKAHAQDTCFPSTESK